MRLCKHVGLPIDRSPLTLRVKALHSNGARLFPRRHPNLMLASRELYAEGRHSVYRNSLLKLDESAGKLTHQAVARFRTHSSGRAKAVRVARFVKSQPTVYGPATTSYINFTAYTSSTHTVLIEATSAQIAAKVSHTGIQGQAQRHSQWSGHTELCVCEVEALAASIGPSSDALLVFLDAYLNRIGHAPSVAYYLHPQRNARRCPVCSSLTSTGA